MGGSSTSPASSQGRPRPRRLVLRRAYPPWWLGCCGCLRRHHSVKPTISDWLVKGSTKCSHRQRVRAGHLGLGGSHPLETYVLKCHELSGNKTPPGSRAGRYMMPLQRAVVPIAVATIFPIAIAPVFPAAGSPIVAHPGGGYAINRDVANCIDVSVVDVSREGVVRAAWGVSSIDTVGGGGERSRISLVPPVNARLKASQAFRDAWCQ